LDDKIVSCCISKPEYSAIKVTNSKITVTTNRPESEKTIDDITLYTSFKSKNWVRMFIGCKIAYAKRKFEKSIYFLGYFFLSDYSPDEMVFTQIM
jgi:hypothetical protein